MNDRKAAQIEGKITQLINKWLGPAGFGWLRIYVMFERNNSPDGEQVAAATETLWEYREATIYFYLPTCADLTDDQLEIAVVHELCHTLVAPIEDMANDDKRARTELAVTNVTNALLLLRNRMREQTQYIKTHSKPIKKRKRKK